MALRGVGDKRLGAWRENTGTGFAHYRKRCTEEEEDLVGEVKDLRGTDEGRARVAAMSDMLAKLPIGVTLAIVGELKEIVHGVET